MKALTVAAFVALVWGMLTQMAENCRHSCPFENCPYQGQKQFQYSGKEIGGDVWKLDKAHWHHPTWDYDQLEAYVFGE